MALPPDKRSPATETDDLHDLDDPSPEEQLDETAPEDGLEPPSIPHVLDELEVEGSTGLFDPLPPLIEILPEHIRYVRLLIAGFAVVPPDWREDLVQEVLVEAYASRGSQLDVRALLFGIARHKVLAWLDKRRAERQIVQFQARVTAQRRSIENDWRDAERRLAVQAAIDELPEQLREVFVRMELDRQTMPEIARELDIPLTTGYTRIYLARARFLDALRRILIRRGVPRGELAIPLTIGGGSGAAQQSETGIAPGSQAPPDPKDLAISGKPAGSLKLGAAAQGSTWKVGAFVAAAATVTVGVWVVLTSDPGSSEVTPIAEPLDSGRDAGLAQPSSSSAPRNPPSSSPLPTPPPKDGGVDADASAPAQAGASGPDDDPYDGTRARRILLLIKQGHLTAARVEADAYRRDHPHSPYIVAIEQMYALKSKGP